MDSSEKRMIIQCDSYEKVQRAYANFKKSPKEKLTTGYLTSRLESLEVYLKDFKKLHQKIIQEIAREDRNSFYYFNDEIYENFEELYFTYKGELSDALQPDKENDLEHSENKECQTQNEIKLPHITIPTFSGDYTEWQSFHSSFTSLVHNNDTLEDVQKLHYLESNLKGEPETLLENLVITAENYANVWSILQWRYSNKKYIENVFEKFFGQQSICYQATANLLKQLLDTSEECVDSLKNLGLYTAQSEPMLVYVIVSKLNLVTQGEWNTYMITQTSFASFEQLKFFLEKQIKTLTDLERIEPKKNTVVNSEPPLCTLCNMYHYLYDCQEFAKKTIEEKYIFAHSTNVCFNCLRYNHKAFECPKQQKCRFCRKYHHSYMHYD